MRVTTSSYIVKFRLLTNEAQRRELDHRFFLAQKVYNCMVKEARRRVNAYYRDKAVKSVWLRCRKKSYQLCQEDKSILKQVRDQYGLSEYAFHAFLTVQARKYRKHLDSCTIQKIGTAVWQSTSKILFGKGKMIHFKAYDRLLSVEGKRNKSGIRFKDGMLHWLGLEIPVRLRTDDLYAQKALCDRIKYCRIVRRWHGSEFRYFLQLVLEGTPQNKPKRTVKHAQGGLDLGTSTVAAVSSEGIVFQELGAGIASIEKEIARLSRKLDRQRRASNPQNYDSAGRIKRLRKGEQRVWHYSSGYRKTRNQLRTLYTRRAAKLKQSHEILANKILAKVGNELFVENMSISGLAKRSRKDKMNPRTGRPASKKRFGKSVQNHAPSQFVGILSRKAEATGGHVSKVNPYHIKASQYNHFTDTYQKATLQERWKTLQPGEDVQRDLYSAFLLSNLDPHNLIDRSRCTAGYPEFKSMHDSVIQTLWREKASGRRFPSCMGI